MYFFINGPANTLNAFSGLMNTVLNYIQGLGG
ncbi:TcpD family membrane protein [Leuconostoc lactis]|nr:TcpD family membrane protein [Leuconostoc lactis]